MIDDAALIHPIGNAHFWNFELFKRWFIPALYAHHEPATYYRPLFNMALYVETWFWGIHPLGYHVISVLFQALNAVLILELVLCLGFSLTVAMLTGALFAVHPIIIGEMMPAAASGMMGLFFMLLTLYAFCSSKRNGYLIGCLCYALALLTKESNVVIPLLLGLCFYLQRRSKMDYKKIIPLLLYWPFYLSFLASNGSMDSHISALLLLRFYMHAFISIAFRFFLLVLVPWNLVSWRVLPPPTSLWPFYWLCFIGMIFFLHARGWRWAVFSFGWFFITLSPYIMAVTTHNALMDQWVYPGLLAVLLPISLCVAWGLSTSNAYLRYGSMIFYSSLIAGCMSLIFFNVKWRGSDEKNFKWTFEHYPEADFAKRRFLSILLNDRRWDEALFYLERFHNDDPNEPTYAHDLALLKHQLKRT